MGQEFQRSAKKMTYLVSSGRGMLKKTFDNEGINDIWKNAYVAKLCWAMVDFFDVRYFTTSHRSPRRGLIKSITITFCGIAENTTMAARAFEMVFNICGEWGRDYKGTNGRNSYARGVADELSKTALKLKEEEEIRAREAEQEALARRIKEEKAARQAELDRLAGASATSMQASVEDDDVVEDFTQRGGQSSIIDLTGDDSDILHLKQDDTRFSHASCGPDGKSSIIDLTQDDAWPNYNGHATKNESEEDEEGLNPSAQSLGCAVEYDSVDEDDDEDNCEQADFCEIEDDDDDQDFNEISLDLDEQISNLAAKLPLQPDMKEDRGSATPATTESHTVKAKGADSPVSHTVKAERVDSPVLQTVKGERVDSSPTQTIKVERNDLPAPQTQSEDSSAPSQQWASHMQLMTFRETAHKLADDYIKERYGKLRTSRKRPMVNMNWEAYRKGQEDSKKIDVRRQTIEYGIAK